MKTRPISLLFPSWSNHHIIKIITMILMYILNVNPPAYSGSSTGLPGTHCRRHCKEVSLLPLLTTVTVTITITTIIIIIIIIIISPARESYSKPMHWTWARPGCGSFKTYTTKKGKKLMDYGFRRRYLLTASIMDPKMPESSTILSVLFSAVV